MNKIMKGLQYKPKKITGNISKLIFFILSVTAATTSIAEINDGSSGTTYVDSVTQWGPWELDIEPAAGGLTQATAQALKARTSKVTLRTNSISALAPQRSIPTPPKRLVTPPFGGPANGFF